MRKLLVLLLFFFISTYLLLAEEIQYIGLKRTKPSYLNNVLAPYLGRKLSDEDLAKMKLLLLKEGLFSEISIKREDGGIHIYLKEKLAILPLPFVSYSSTGWMGGLCLFDMNAFGMKHQALLVGMLREDSQLGMVSYSKPVIWKKGPGFGINLSFSRNDLKVRNLDNEEIANYKDTGLFSLRLHLSYKLLESLTAQGSYSYQHKAFQDLGDQNWHRVSFSLGYSKSSHNGLFLLQSSLSGQVKVSYRDSDHIGKEFVLRGQLERSLRREIRIRFSLGLVRALDTELLEQPTRSEAGIKLIPSYFRSSSFYGGSVDAEFSVLEKEIFNISLLLGYQGLLTENQAGDMEFVHGPGCGLMVYLKKIAIPALSAEAYYNVPKEYVQFSFSLGVSM